MLINAAFFFNKARRKAGFQQPEHLQQYGQQDKPHTYEKTTMQLPVLFIKQECKQDAIHRLQVYRERNGEG